VAHVRQNELERLRRRKIPRPLRKERGVDQSSRNPPRPLIPPKRDGSDPGLSLHGHLDPAPARRGSDTTAAASPRCRPCTAPSRCARHPVGAHPCIGTRASGRHALPARYELDATAKTPSRGGRAPRRSWAFQRQSSRARASSTVSHPAVVGKKNPSFSTLRCCPLNSRIASGWALRASLGTSAGEGLDLDRLELASDAFTFWRSVSGVSVFSVCSLR
jgi:hypothetical protein